VLLIGGGLMLQSLRKLLKQDPGFSAQHILTFGVNLPGVSYPRAKVWPFADPTGLRFAHEFVERLRNVPGVQGVSAVSGLPANENRSRNRFMVEGQPSREGQEEACMSRRVGTDYFAVMKIPLIAGRGFTASDTPDAPPVAIVNQAWVKRYSGGQDPIGQRLRLTFSPNEPFRQIVGVIGDVAEDSLAAPPSPALYLPLDQDSGFTIFLGYVIRSRQDPAALVSSVRTILRGLDPQLAIVEPRSMEQIVNQSPAVFLRRYPFYLIGSFATLALVLAMIGLYGLISYSVMGRTREIGIRLALGAQRKDILRLILRQGVITTGIGVGVGLVAGLASTRVMASLLYSMNYGDWIVFASVAAFLAAIAITASYVPARRATQVDPMVTLRNE
jgi:putative ABC transport system permease protein